MDGVEGALPLGTIAKADGVLVLTGTSGKVSQIVVSLHAKKPAPLRERACDREREQWATIRSNKSTTMYCAGSSATH